MKMRAVLCRRSCSCLVEPLLRMLCWIMFSSGSSSSRIRGCSGCLVTSTSIRSSTCGQKAESACAEHDRREQLRAPGDYLHTHPDLEVPSELLLLLQLVFLLMPGLDAHLLLCK